MRSPPGGIPHSFFAGNTPRAVQENLSRDGEGRGARPGNHKLPETMLCVAVGGGGIPVLSPAEKQIFFLVFQAHPAGNPMTLRNPSASLGLLCLKGFHELFQYSRIFYFYVKKKLTHFYQCGLFFY